MRTLAYFLSARALLLVLTCGQARADEPPAPEELARRHHDRGSTFYNLGQFEEAIAEYRKGYEQKADPVFLYNIGQSYRQIGAHDKALFFYRRYLTTAGEASNRQVVEDQIVELEQLVEAERHARSPAPPTPLSGVAATPPASAPAAPSSSPSSLSSSSGEAAARLSPPMPALAGATRADLVDPAQPPGRPGHVPMWHRWWFWAGIGGLVAGGIAVGLLVSSADGGGRAPGDLGAMRFF